MMKAELTVLAVFFVCLGVVPVNGIRCYKCEYTNAVPSYNPFCDVNFDATSFGASASIVDCDGICYKASGEIAGLLGVERKCETNRTVSDCSNGCGAVKGAPIGGCEHCCDTDLCNGASSVTFNLLAAVAMLTFSWIVILDLRMY